MTPTAAALGGRARSRVGIVVTGLALGAALSRIGFTDYQAVIGMFTFADLRMFLVFAGGVALTGLGLELVRTMRGAPRTAGPPLRKSAIVGGVIFGAGWAIAGACPGVAFAQVGEGKLWALITIAGMALGTLAYHGVRTRLGLGDDEPCGSSP